MDQTTVRLCIVLPCYNEQDVLEETNVQIHRLMYALQDDGAIAADSTILYVDDGSSDGTWKMIEHFSMQSGLVKGVKLSRNCGHQNALLAGMLTADGDAVISVDADLQDDLAAIPEMVSAYASGYDVVYGVRQSRTSDSLFKRYSAEMFYRIMRLLGVAMVYNHADYRLLSRRALTNLGEFSEVNLFLRGIIPLIGLSSITVYYDRKERIGGTSKYSLRKMISFAINGLTSFSAFPLRFVALAGVVTFVFSMIMTAWALYIRLFTHDAVPGWASTLIPMYILGGIQLLGIGVLGEYVGKIYLETKRRPRYFIERTTIQADHGSNGEH